TPLPAPPPCPSWCTGPSSHAFGADATGRVWLTHTGPLAADPEVSVMLSRDDALDPPAPGSVRVAVLADDMCEPGQVRALATTLALAADILDGPGPSTHGGAR
ncbi:hypothetical protein, partial [Kribbia dieselivorans]|uniref:hypothetical protein n=1 Tax=Kribbia dieselivorans TaxID=331526 RepID=UPI001470189F